jgi:glycosyltransferase involved in cell wall biosynthesis
MSKKQNILFLTLKTFSVIGGIEHACRSLIYAIQQNERLNLTTFSMYDKSTDAIQQYINKSIFRGFGSKKIAFTLEVLIKSINFDQVILSHINLLIFGKIIKILKPSTKIILWAHGIEVWRPIPSWKKNFLQGNAEIWAVSKYTKQQLIERHKIPAEKIKVLNNTLDPFFSMPILFEKPDYLLHRYNISTDTFILFTLTRLSETEIQKNYDLVINCIEKLKDEYPRLVYLIGGKADETELRRLQNLIIQKKLDAYVRLLGYIHDYELTNHFLLSNCFVLPSKKEGFGIVFIEAAACGCQVIGGNADGSADALLNGELGQMVDPNSEIEIMNAIKKAIHNKTHQPKTQQKKTLKNFGFDVYTQKVAQLLAQ